MTTRKPRKRKPLCTLVSVLYADGWGIDVPIITVSEANQREHWRVKHKRKKSQQAMIAICLSGIHETPQQKARICAVELHRFGGRSLDQDNLASSFKHVQDAVAKWIGIDDGNARVQWSYTQDKCDHQRGITINLTFSQKKEAV